MKTLDEDVILNNSLDFLWLELTTKCNLRCIHCYAESEPNPETSDLLSIEDYRNVITSAAKLDCKKLQFIGGEATLVPELSDLIIHARKLGFTFVELFTNATRISDGLLQCLIANEVEVAVSFYSKDASIHDAITKKTGSHAHTLKTIQKLLTAGLKLRVGIIVMDLNRDSIDETIAFLKSTGIENVGLDRVRSVGRGTTLLPDTESNLSELCGSCWRGSICVSPTGGVSPCIMSKRWSVGSILSSSLGDIVGSLALRQIRQRIHDEVWMAGTKEQNLGSPCSPNCSPRCSPECNPASCNPRNKCNPDLYCGPCYPGK
jgi:MoaA/NifB/PqqE/SkfB family radical SAM enzyme